MSFSVVLVNENKDKITLGVFMTPAISNMKAFVMIVHNITKNSILNVACYSESYYTSLITIPARIYVHLRVNI